MDNFGYLLLSRSHNQTMNTLIFDMAILFVLVPILKYFFDDIQLTYKILLNKFINTYKSKIEFTGWENLLEGNFTYEYPLPMTAICHYLSNNNICTNLKYFNPVKNGNFYYDNSSSNNQKDSNISYLINFGNNIYIGDDMYIDYTYHSIQCSKESKSDGNWKIIIVLKSNKKTIIEINKFILKCIKEYENYLNEKSNNKIYHFIFQGNQGNQSNQSITSNKKLIFSSSVLSDYSNLDKTSYETFSNLESEHNTMLIKDINRLKDLEYYKKTGNRRKKGYLFYGPPGCGKTSSVIAMALEDKRHIIEISMSRIKTNQDLENLFNLTEINGIKFEKHQIILLFDEIDTGFSIQQNIKLEKKNNKTKIKTSENKTSENKTSENKTSENKTSENKTKDTIVNKPLEKDDIILKLLTKYDDTTNCNFIKKDNDSINLGCILSRFDGVGSYNGIIIIATTNCKDQISPALYRNGRLNPVFFNYITKKQIKSMIEKFYDIILTEKEIEKLPDIEIKMSHSTIKKLLDDYDDNLPELLIYLGNLKKN